MYANRQNTSAELFVDSRYRLVRLVSRAIHNIWAFLTDSWVAGTACTVSACSGLTKYNSGSSSTYTTSNKAFDISYGSGDAEGTIASDTITMGGFTVQQQGFGELKYHTIHYPELIW